MCSSCSALQRWDDFITYSLFLCAFHCSLNGIISTALSGKPCSNPLLQYWQLLLYARLQHRGNTNYGSTSRYENRTNWTSKLRFSTAPFSECCSLCTLVNNHESHHGLLVIHPCIGSLTQSSAGCHNPGGGQGMVRGTEKILQTPGSDEEQKSQGATRMDDIFGDGEATPHPNPVPEGNFSRTVMIFSIFLSPNFVARNSAIDTDKNRKVIISRLATLARTTAGVLEAHDLEHPTNVAMVSDHLGGRGTCPPPRRSPCRGYL